jgi:hypothetical protein
MSERADCHLDPMDENTSQNITLENSADVCNLDRFIGAEQRVVHMLHVIRQISSTLGQNASRHFVVFALGFIEQGCV